MIRRVFSRNTYNGYHIVHYQGDGEDPSPIGFFKKLTTKDEYGFQADPEDQPKCPNPGFGMGRPWDNWLYVPSGCQKCSWVYRTSQNEFDCLLATKERINPKALVRSMTLDEAPEKEFFGMKYPFKECARPILLKQERCLECSMRNFCEAKEKRPSKYSHSSENI